MSEQKKNKQQIIDLIESNQLRDDLPVIRTGDTVSVHIKIIEGNKTRIQKFNGIVMRTKGHGIAKTFLVRKETDGVAIEQNFFYNSPLITKILVSKHGKVRRAYITYMRERSGKTARLKEVVKKK
ncbi:MAG: 50S ribosomal protein L19 [Mycoplasmataceae bacterium]|jgi:large subunit ribosomal protein L19|nr:50S ribosomal protein L19 [Mycoplasmataceae bacterium]